MLPASNETLLASCNAAAITPGMLIIGTLCVSAIVITIRLLAMSMPCEKNHHAINSKCQ
jgi:hypothetical protein